jgi:hypothetical protein
MKRRARIAACLGGALIFPAGVAGADVTWIPGTSREISRELSASLDAPVTTIVFMPRDELKPALDVGIVKVPLSGVALRPGVSGFADVQWVNTGGFTPIPPSTGQILFRGHFELSLSLAAETLAHRLFGPRGTLEITAGVGHESDHVLGSGGPDDGFVNAPRPGDIINGGGGNFALYDVAVLAPALRGRIALWARGGDRIYVDDPVLHLPSLEGGVRVHAWPRVEPVASVYGEVLLADPNVNHGKDGGDVQGLLGLALAGAFGEATPFVAVDVGNQKGLLINHREADLVFGVRYAPF